jgi:apolipoprotein N-acyltransferase
VLPGQATRAAGRREEDDLPGLRLILPVVIRRLSLAAVAGGLLFAGHPPLDWAWAGWIALVPLLWLAHDIGPGALRESLGWGLVAGIAFFAPLLQWIGRFGIAPWALLTMVQAAFVAVFVAVVAAWGPRRARWLVAACAWVGLEWLRSWFPLSGFPWGVLGYTQHNGGPLLPLSRVLGVLGVSLALALFAAGLAELASRRVWRARGRAVPPAVAVVAVLGLSMGLPGSVAEQVGTVDIAGVQGNDIELPPFIDRANVSRVENIAALMADATQELARAPGGLPDVVVWPENALDADPRTSPVLAERVAQAQAAIGDATLLAGTLLDGPRERTFRNSIVRYATDGSIAEVYDKRILVPFGEYVPWRWLFGGLPPLQAIPNDGVAGTEPTVFTVGDAVIGPVTCYESIYPQLVRDQVRAGANVLVVSTNNASFGRTPASRQHLAFSQVRAVETGRWTLHAGISGISAVVDPDGGVHQRTELFERAIVRDELPLLTGITPFVRFGDLVGPLTALLTVMAVVALWLWRRTSPDPPRENP